MRLVGILLLEDDTVILIGYNIYQTATIGLILGIKAFYINGKCLRL